MRLDHPIFKGPLDPRIALGKTPTPKEYRDYSDGKDLPEFMETWKVQEGAYLKDVDAGLVSSPFGFSDSPDAEHISSGINSKGPRSVALGRQGNLFLWGFAGDPSQMTESAKRVFINTIVYMKQFDGQRPLVEKKSRSREWCPAYVSFVKKFGSEGGMKEWLQKHFPQELPFESEALEQIGRASCRERV